MNTVTAYRMMKLCIWVLGLGIAYCAALLWNSHLPCPMRAVATSEQFAAFPPAFSHGQAYAIPRFSRKYTVSCQQCHSAFPNLNPFGEAFKRNGLRYPGEGKDFESPDTVKLGKDDDKQKFPRAVWPGTLPKSLPLSFVASGEYTSMPEDSSTNQKNQFQNLGSDITLLAADTLGDHFAFWGEGDFASNVDLVNGTQTIDVSVDRLYAVINPFIKPSLVIRVGSFEPQVAAISEHRSLLGDYFLSSHTVGDNGFTLEPSQQGIEFAEVWGKGRLGLVEGVVEGTGNEYNNNKDFYARVEYKLGGLRLDGVQSTTSAVKSAWRDDSIKVGAFTYAGFATVTDGTTQQTDHFQRFGGDIEINYFNFLSTLVYARQEDSQPLLANPGTSAGSNQFMGEINYNFYWLFPGVRYEFFDSADSTGGRDQRLSVGSTFLITPNIKTYAQGRFLRVSNGGFMDSPEIHVGLVLAL